MNDDERTVATAREHAAFLRGYSFGAEAAVRAHADLIEAVTLLMGCIMFGAASLDVLNSQGERRELDDGEALVIAEGRVRAAGAEVRRVREQGAVQALALFDVERQMAVDR